MNTEEYIIEIPSSQTVCTVSFFFPFQLKKVCGFKTIDGPAILDTTYTVVMLLARWPSCIGHHLLSVMLLAINGPATLGTTCTVVTLLARLIQLRILGTDCHIINYRWPSSLEFYSPPLVWSLSVVSYYKIVHLSMLPVLGHHQLTITEDSS